MARFRGPRMKVSRRFGEPIFGTGKALQQKPYGPGQHGRNRRRKQSEYAVQLGEKQKIKYLYGVLERQFRKNFKEAARRKGVTGTNLLQLLESRLDNVVYRLGFAPTRRAARQLVGHRHIIVNGQLVNIPSYNVNPGDVITVKGKSQSIDLIKNTVKGGGKYPWIEWNNEKFEGTFVTYPERDQIPENVKENLVVELYSK